MTISLLSLIMAVNKYEDTLDSLRKYQILKLPDERRITSIAEGTYSECTTCRSISIFGAILYIE